MAKWTGLQTQGSTAYTPDQRRRVVALLVRELAGQRQAMRIEDILNAFAREIGDVEPRQLRKIISDADGEDFLTVDGKGRLWLAETADEAEAKTRELEARARSELRRVARRTAFANTRLGRQQQAMALGMGSAGVEA